MEQPIDLRAAPYRFELSLAGWDPNGGMGGEMLCVLRTRRFGVAKEGNCRECCLRDAVDQEINAAGQVREGNVTFPGYRGREVGMVAI